MRTVRELYDLLKQISQEKVEKGSYMDYFIRLMSNPFDYDLNLELMLNMIKNILSYDSLDDTYKYTLEVLYILN